MIIIDYDQHHHRQIIRSCAVALRQGKVVAYPTDTSYGLAVDARNPRALKKLYRVKQRPFRQPAHIVVPSVNFAKKVAKWNDLAQKLSEKFWPGPLTLVLELKAKGLAFRLLSAQTKTLGLRLPDNKIALDLARRLKGPITATSANPPNRLGGYDSYTIKDIIKQFRKKKFQPDIILNVGRLPKRRPSTLVSIQGQQVVILRLGPVTKKQIQLALAG